MIYREVARKLARMGCQEIPRRGGGAHRKCETRLPIVPRSWQTTEARTSNLERSGQ
jgi:hypothetical protein